MRVSVFVQLCGMVALGGSPLYAQTPPPIHGLTGTIATDATIRDEHKAANTIVVKTEDGVEHVYRAMTGRTAHGKDVLADLKPGTTVLVHYRAADAAREADRVGTDALSTTEGIATRIDRGKNEITVRYDDGRIEALKLTDAAPADMRSIGADIRIVAYSSTGSGQKVARYFTTVK